MYRLTLLSYRSFPGERSRTRLAGYAHYLVLDRHDRMALKPSAFRPQVNLRSADDGPYSAPTVPTHQLGKSLAGLHCC